MWEQVPLRPIRTHADYDRAAAVLGGLAVREDELDPGEAEYFEVLTLLVEAYDDAHFPFDTSDAGPVDTLKFLMEQAGMTRADLGTPLGSERLASDILDGRRAMSRRVTATLGRRFAVEPGLFDRPNAAKQGARRRGRIASS